MSISLERPALSSSEAVLVTGAAGFVGSHLCEPLIELGQTVVALDDFSTGHSPTWAHCSGIRG
jgi:nucleoside-diphosphate-sugar epimerase